MKQSYWSRSLVSLILPLIGLTALSIPQDRSPGGTVKPKTAVEASAANVPESNPDSSKTRTADLERKARLSESYGRLPLAFEANCGQADPRIEFLSRGNGANIYLAASEAVVDVRNGNGAERKTGPGDSKSPAVSWVRMKLLGANAQSRSEGLDRLPGNSNYLIGNDQKRWHTNVPNYARVRYQDIYPGVSLIYYGNQRQLEYDFVLGPGGDPHVIKLGFQGTRGIRIDANGDLMLRMKSGNLRMQKPVVYQNKNESKQFISGRYVLRGKDTVGFEVAAYDRSKELIIDPVFGYSTYLGGTGFDEGKSIVVDSSGNAYVTGRTTSFNFPITIDAYDTTYANSYDVFVTKMNAAGTALIYSTYLGGSNEDQGYGIAVDSSSNAYVTGSTSSSDYPITLGAFQTVPGSNFTNDTFVTKLNPAGTGLIYSTFLGGFNSDQGNSIVVDSTGNAYVAGVTSSSNFPTTPGAFQTVFAGGGFPNGDAFITKVNSVGTALVYSTFLGGVGSDQATGIAIDSPGNAYVTGSTNSTDFDVTPGAFQTIYGGSNNFSGNGDAFATQLNTTGTALIYSTYLGGIDDDAGLGISVDGSGNAYITGSTFSVNFPSTPGVIRVSNGGAAKSTNGGNGWAAINNGLTNSTVLSLAVDPTNPMRLYAGTSGGGIFKSTNGGGVWGAVNSGLTDLFIKTIAIDPANTILAYLGTNNRGVFRTTDGGSSWRAINTGQNGMNVNTLKLDPSNSATIYAGTDQGVYKTTNGGANWTSINTGFGFNPFINALAVNPSNSSIVYAAINFGGVYKSTNGGANWSATPLSNNNVRSLIVDPSVPATVYAGGDGGVFKSTNSGGTWGTVNTGLNSGTKIINSLVLSPADSNTIYAGTANGFFKSTNGGTAWSALNSGLAGAVINALAIDPLNAMNIYSGASAGSTDAFITKVNSTGTGLIYSTFLGGNSFDQGTSISVSASGNAYVTGSTQSTNFPTTPGVFQTISSSFNQDAFLTKLDPAGTTLVYSTFLGGDSFDQGNGVAVDSSGSAYVTGTTQSNNFPITPGAFQTSLSGNSFNGEGFISKFDVTPTLSSDLRISMTASPPSGAAGSNITYNIAVTNDGPERASSVTVTDDLPLTTVFQSCGGFGCTHAGNSVSFNFNSLDVGVTQNMSIFATVSCAIDSTVAITNTAMVTSGSIDPNPGNNSAMAMTTGIPVATTLNPMSQDFTANGGSSQLSVNQGNGNCSWTSASNVSWITITFSSNCCNGVVSYTVAANSGAPRAGTMTVAGKTFTVNQAGTCAVSISPTAASYGAAGGVGAVNVTAPAGCNWSTLSSVPWITVTSGASGSGNGTVGYSVAANMTTGNRIGSINIGGQTLVVVQTRPGGTSRTTFDFDGDAKSDVSVRRPTSGTWFIINSTNNSIRTQGWGINGDMMVPGDYDGDGKTDVAVWRPTSGTWFIFNSSDGSTRSQGWGFNGDTPVPGDYDGDGKTDLAVWRPSSGTWFILNSSNGSTSMASWGTSSDVPVQADYDGDGKADMAVWRPSTGVWFIINSSNSSTRTQGWGVNADTPVPGDYDGDGKADLAVWRPSSGTWFIFNSSNQTTTSTSWGVMSDKPVPADYDGDGKADIAVWRPSSGTWHIISSINGSMSIVSWGVNGDIPVPSAFIGM